MFNRVYDAWYTVKLWLDFIAMAVNKSPIKTNSEQTLQAKPWRSSKKGDV
jgi:hypothetical protein